MVFFVASHGIPVPKHTSLLKQMLCENFLALNKSGKKKKNSLCSLWIMYSVLRPCQGCTNPCMNSNAFSIQYQGSIMQSYFQCQTFHYACNALNIFKLQCNIQCTFRENILTAIFALFPVHWTICSCHSCPSSLFTQCRLTDCPAYCCADICFKLHAEQTDRKSQLENHISADTNLLNVYI